MDRKVTRESRRLVYEGRILKVYEDTMIFPDGKRDVWDYIHHDGASAVVAVLPDGRLLLVSQYRNSLDDLMWEIPAGKLDGPEEDPKESAKRELEEETGYLAGEMEHLLTLRSMVAFCNEKVEVYVANHLEKTAQNLDETEFLSVKGFFLEEVKAMIYSGEITDSKTIASVLTYEDRCVKSRA